MLLELTIRNIALIESLRIEFAQGFNVLTGETGAGKSIVVDSVNLALGGRADRDMIRTGAEKGSVQALFDISRNPRAQALAAELGVDAEDNLVCVSRELSRSGRNICRISGTVLPLATLKQFTALLVDVHGQHEHQSLMNPAKHLEFLDAFGDGTHIAKMEAVRTAHAARTTTASELRRLLKDASERERLIDMLRFQVEEITSAKLKSGEEEKLERKLHMLENAEKVRNGVETAYELTYGGDGRSLSAQEALLRSSSAMEGIAGLDARFEKLAGELKGLYYGVQEAGAQLQALSEELSFDPRLMDRIGDRLDLISRLERKYGATVEEVIAFGNAAKARLDSIQSGDARISELKKQLKAQDRELRAACEELTQSRHVLADEFERGLLEQLKDLGMARTRFQVDFKAMEKPTAEGADQVEFLISPNPGEPLKPLASVASGGELSRIMLAIKTLSINRGGVDSMVFDEIDTGVSGRMAQVVGEKMQEIATQKQVLCVTHLPQIAALGDAHFRVEKSTDGEHTRTDVVRLDHEGRIREISRLVGGAEDSESSLSHASHMLMDAQERLKRLMAAQKDNETLNG